MRPPETTALLAMQREFLADFTGRRVLGAEERARRFLPPPAGSLEHRWEVYARGYLSRLVEALENDYPALRRILGPGAFGSLAARYVAACPPRGFDLGRVGDRLAGFLDNDPLTADLPFLPDLARLEWALAEAFVAEDGEPLAWDELARLGPERVAAARLGVLPGTALVASRWPLHALWRTRELGDGHVSVELDGPPTSTLVWRSSHELRCRELAPAEAALVALALAGGCLGEMDEALVAAEGPEAVTAAFRQLALEGALTLAVSRPSSQS